MMKAIRQTNTAASFLKQVFLYCPRENYLAISHKMVWENSMMIRRSCAPAYRDLASGEDSEFVKDLVNHHKIAVLEAPGQYAYVRTNANTIGEDSFNNLFKRAQKNFNAEQTEQILSIAPCFKAL